MYRLSKVINRILRKIRDKAFVPGIHHPRAVATPNLVIKPVLVQSPLVFTV